MYSEEKIEQIARNIRRSVQGGASRATAVSDLRGIVPDELIELALARFEMWLSDLAGAIVAADPELAAEAWYAGPQQKDVYWPRVEAVLRNKLGDDAVSEVDKTTNAVLSKLHAPFSEAFSDRALVLGYVQSGKTTNFISLAAKAADVGYKLIVVLSGVTDNLRDQTQNRVDELLVQGQNDWYRLTTPGTDFDALENAGALLGPQFGGRLIAVVKKNPHRLRRLRDWLRGAGKLALKHSPLLLIDDEADQASIDIGKERTSTINRLLREILRHPRSAYVAYTATPFANLLIDPSTEDDLYPRTAIISMPRPNEYFGAERLFGDARDPEDGGLDMIRSISDDEAARARPASTRAAVANWVPEAGPALRDAVEWFLLATTARRIRAGSVAHSTMLVHTSMLSDAHFRTLGLVETMVEKLRSQVASGDVPALARLEALWNSESPRLAGEFGYAPVQWSQIGPALLRTIEMTRVIVDNYRSDDRLSYSDGQPTTAIVIGGNTLSRGLTLEGLCASYFVRSASAYDTLLQMGRWFGYRHGYEDLCRVWMTDELQSWFRDLSTVESEIRAEIDRYAVEGLTPLELGVRIRKHPKMAITAEARMRNHVTTLFSYSGSRPQTTVFSRTDTDVLENNLAVVRKLLDRIVRGGGQVSSFRGGTTLGNTNPGFRDVPVRLVTEFLSEYVFDERQRDLSSSALLSYIGKQNRDELLEKWRVVVMDGADGESIELPGVGGVRSVRRSRVRDVDDSKANIRTLTSGADFSFGVDWVAGEPVPEESQFPTVRSERHPAEGILRIYHIDRMSPPARSRKDRIPLDAPVPVVGLSIDFPVSPIADADVTYVVADVPGTIEIDEAELDALDAADEAEAGAESLDD